MCMTAIIPYAPALLFFLSLTTNVADESVKCISDSSTSRAIHGAGVLPKLTIAEATNRQGVSLLQRHTDMRVEAELQNLRESPHKDKQVAYPCEAWTDSASGKRWCKPHFLFLGCQKCGSSSFYHAMKQHQHFHYKGPKELCFWKGDDTPLGGTTSKCNLPENEYFNHFVDIPASEDGGHVSAITGEFSATYFECACCPALFKQIMPQTKMLLMLREPMSRAMSRFDEQVSFLRLEKSTQWESFRNARLSQLKDCLSRSGDDVLQQAVCAENDNVLGWSLYDAFLETWIRAGYDRTTLHIIYLDDWRSDADSQMRNVESFLGIAEANYTNLANQSYNVRGKYGWDSLSLLATDDALRSFYSKSLQRLRELCKAGGWPMPPDHWGS